MTTDIYLKRKIVNLINKALKNNTYDFSHLSNIIINGSKRGCSGFILNPINQSCVYINTERSCATWLPRFMYRQAKSVKDFTGATNRWANTSDELAYNIINLLENPEFKKDGDLI